MTDLTVTLLPNGTAKPPGKAMALAFGYKGNRGIYGLNVTASGIWKGLTIRVCWHGPCSKVCGSTLVINGHVDVPAAVTASPGKGVCTFEGTDGNGVTITSADLPYIVYENSGTDTGEMPEPGTPAWEAFVAEAFKMSLPMATPEEVKHYLTKFLRRTMNMANYDLNHIPALRDLQDLAKRQNAKHKALNLRVKALEDIGAQANKIESIKVNGTAQTIDPDKSVNITVPTKTSQLNNDSTFQTSAQVVEAINTAISKSGHASFQKVDAVPNADAAQENILYLVMNTATKHYDIYAKIKGSSGSYTMELLDDTTVDLSGKVDKVAGKDLSTNDYTTAEKNKLAGIAEGANNYVHPSYTAKASGLYKVTVDATGHVSAVAAVTKDDITALGIPGSDTKYGNATTTNAGLMSAADKAKLDSLVLATEVEVTAMLDEVFAGE